MKNLLKKIIRKLLLVRLRGHLLFKAKIKRNFDYDIRRFETWSGLHYKNLRKEQKRAMIIKDYHRIEKGFAFERPKVPFGLTVARDLMRYLDDYIKNFGSDATVQTAFDVLTKYMQYHNEANHPVKDIEEEFNRLKNVTQYQCRTALDGGFIELTREDVQSQSLIDLERFFSSRHSLRHFSDQPVSVALIEKAIDMARRTPSVCNRQSFKVHLYTDKVKMAEILKFQNGNTGFTHQIDKLLIITSDLRAFLNIGERYQSWIDGGMFAMSVMYALHSLGLGSCCLNWSVEFETDQEARKIANLPENENIIMFMAVGHLPERFRVAQSTRKTLDEYLVKH